MRESVKLAREILAQPAFEEFCDYEIKPGIDVQSDEAIDEFVRNNSETEYHPSCSCRMGDSNQNDTVVGFDGKVVGKILFYITVMPEQEGPGGTTGPPPNIWEIS